MKLPSLPALAACALTALAPLTAQRSLDLLQREFVEASRRLDADRPTREQREELLKGQIAELQRFLTKEAAGDDRWNGRLMLADLSLVRGHREDAVTALQSIDAEQAPALLLISAATLAQHLDLRKLRDRWIEVAIAKQSPVEDRMAMARLLMLVLREVDRADKLFADSLAAAADDEQRALVRWHHADVLRDREDLPENTGFVELEKLARELPKTYWGSVAKDRLRATRLARGDAAIPFAAKTIDGKTVSLQALRGQVVVLTFWSASDYDTPTLVSTLADLQRKHAEALTVVGICLDRDPKAIVEAVAKLGIRFAVVGDGKGIENDIALRWFVEGPTLHVIDGAGKVRALGLHVGTADARSELANVIAAARR